MSSNIGVVKSVFEAPERYLDKRQCDIRIRMETVRSFTAGQTFRRVLDIGCGNGAISLPLLGPETRLTLLDLSSNMAYVARSNIPAGLRENVEVRNEDFMAASLDSAGFDLVICLGVLAYAQSPEEFVKKLESLLTPAGSLILEFADSFHFVGRVVRFLNWLRHLGTPPRYQANVLSFAHVNRLCAKQGLRMVSMFRYDLIPLPNMRGLRRVLESGGLYSLMRMVFGKCGNNRNAALGNEYICLLTREKTLSQA
jgi:predicted TPR repeat methyltransferase